jgi:hypothetical protein
MTLFAFPGNCDGCRSPNADCPNADIIPIAPTPPPIIPIIERREGEAETFEMCSEEAFIIGLIPLFAKTFKLDDGKVQVHLKIMPDDLQVKNFDSVKPKG